MSLFTVNIGDTHANYQSCRRRFKFAPEHCDGAAFWLRGGYCPLWAGWCHEFLPRCEAAGCQFLRYDDQVGGWQRETAIAGPPEQAVLYRLTPALERLRFVYIHGNPGDAQGVDPGLVREMIRHMLSALVEAECRFVAMNGIHGINEAGDHTEAADIANHQRTIDAIYQWRQEFGFEHLQRLYLVDRVGDFGPAEPENHIPG